MTQNDVMIIMINTNTPENSYFSYLSYRNNYYSITPLLTRTLNQNQINTNLSGVIHKILQKTEAKTNSNDTHIRCINWWYTHSMQILLPATASVNPRLSVSNPQKGDVNCHDYHYLNGEVYHMIQDQLVNIKTKCIQPDRYLMSV